MNRFCLNCGYDIVGGDYRKKFCDRSCAAQFNNRKRGNLPMKDCLSDACDKKIQASSSASYCSTICRRMHKFGMWVRNEWIPDTLEFPDWLRDIVIERGCSVCKWKELNIYTNLVPVQIDHINGNPSDHSFANIRALCPNCHSLTPNYGALNKGNGRKHRRNSAVV